VPTNESVDTRVVISGYLKKHTGGIFFATKKRWATLMSNGMLILAKRKDQIPCSHLNLLEFSEFNTDEDQGFSFCTVEDGVILRAVRFYCVEPPSLEDWVSAIQNIWNEAKMPIAPNSPSPRLLNKRAQSMKSIFFGSPETENITDISQMDPIVSVQSGGEPVVRSGYLKKRGGAHGGNRAYKKRWFVVTQYGRVLYFKGSTFSVALGQFSLVDATLDAVGATELRIVTLSRVWELQFESEAERNDWEAAMERIIHSESDSCHELPVMSPARADVRLCPRNVSFIQKSTIALGFHAESPAHDNIIGHQNSITNRISGRQNLESENGKWDQLSVACVTWNLAESLPKMKDISFLRALRGCQVVTVGVQECQSVIYHSFSSDQLSPVDVWLVMVKNALGEGFTLAASRAMGAIHVCVFVRHDVIDCVSNVSTAFVPCGIGNVMYNKGAVGVSMKCYDTSVAFICAHLAANKEKVLDRNCDFHRISALMVESLGKTSTEAKGTRSKTPSADIRDSDSVDLEFCNTRVQERRSTVVEFKGNPLVEFYVNDDVPSVEMKAKSNTTPVVPKGGSKDKDDDVRRSGAVDTRDRLAREFDRVFFFGDLNYRLEAEKLWSQTLLSMSEKMIALEEEELSEALKDESQCLTAIEDDKATESCCAGDKTQGGNMTPNLPSESSKRLALSDVANRRRMSTRIGLSLGVDEDNITEEETKSLQMLVNLVPIGDYGTDDEDDDEEMSPRYKEGKEDMDVLIMQALERGSEGNIIEGDLSAVIDSIDGASVDDEIASTSTPSPTVSSELNCAKQSPIEHSQSHPVSPDDKPLQVFFGNAFRSPVPALSSSAKHALEFFKIQTGFKTPQDIFDRLLDFDQLRLERSKGNVLMGFEEGPITFKPSYKFDPFTEVYDTGKKCRAPAWCDRIFYSTPRYGKEIELQSYESIHGKFHSDHRAVVAIFKVKV